MTRQEAFILLGEYVKNENMQRHCLASEAVMKKLALHFGEDEQKWALAGLLHDLDVEITGADLKVHGLESEKILTNLGVQAEIVEAIKLHNEHAHQIKRQSRFHHALAAGETITGLIMATAMVYPDRKLASVKVKSIVKRMKEKAFAASVDREIIKECEMIGLPLENFASICLLAMQEISDELGL
ncbi:MAG: hydrolase [Bdellovibrionales bacterium RIFOXYB1_FULL_37_110]|nr:MAG: hydrolase [Bdellovibrionales bacterium RIFOXYA1_FULL_38_20]OFZ49502.1 MAG: hydrolase [Bdellovibrionales bacterium RIFOXYC1_FULL_37_79]OFZ58656.1 MAG: hydrolase [Bdellovibrionales bacterium RIFOXYB1_FULL_37_110]OFZ63017.1 MAG: hydrolase [Bdellovibrionales bacterium RIFOXYD1_FULL_36_51]